MPFAGCWGVDPLMMIGILEKGVGEKWVTGVHLISYLQMLYFPVVI